MHLEIRRISLPLGRHDRLQEAQKGDFGDVRIYHSHLRPSTETSSIVLNSSRIKRSTKHHKVCGKALTLRVGSPLLPYRLRTPWKCDRQV